MGFCGRKYSSNAAQMAQQARPYNLSASWFRFGQHPDFQAGEWHMRFDKFTERAQDAASRAVELLQRYGHTQVDTEHILLALLEQPEGIVPGLIEKMGGTVPTMATRLDEELRKSPRVTIYGGGNSEQVFVTPRVKKLTELAQEEANKMKDEFISTEHIFLAISSERNTPWPRGCLAKRISPKSGLHRRWPICAAVNGSPIGRRRRNTACSRSTRAT
jgi:hypothetical protein